MLTMDTFDFKGKKALVRVDLNVPQDANGAVTDDSRARAIVPTVKKILAGGGSVVLMSHLGRPKGKVNPAMSLKPVADHLSNLLGTSVIFATDCVGPDAKAKAAAAGWKGNELTVNADIIVLANPEIALLPNWVIALVAALALVPGLVFLAAGTWPVVGFMVLDVLAIWLAFAMAMRGSKACKASPSPSNSIALRCASASS